MIWLYVFLIGAVIGSFLGVVIERLPQKKTLTGRSHCDYCGAMLRPIDMVPVVSFFCMRGRTTCCGRPLSVFYPSFEMLMGLIFVATTFWLRSNISVTMEAFGSLDFALWCATLLTLWILISACVVILLVDAAHHIIPDEMNIVVILASISWIILDILRSNYGNELMQRGLGVFGWHLFAAFALGGSMLAIFLATKGRGLGFGDVKFSWVMGLLLGLQNGFLALYLAFVIGGVYSLFLLLSKKSTAKTKIAFGPFLIIGTLLMLFFGTPLLTFVQSFFA